MTRFAETAQARLSADGRRLRLTHGPMDLTLTVEGPEAPRQQAMGRAAAAFRPLLGDLVAELPRLRSADGPMPSGLVARRMVVAVAPFAPAFITPMAAVAGSVADHLMQSVLADGHSLTRCHVNNGGDIALWQAGGAVRVAICDDPVSGKSGGHIEIPSDVGIGGIATSGWRGRSFSLGIADAVTVLAETAAAADAAATMIANAVDLPDHTAIHRARACDLLPDSDLGARLVTTGVAALLPDERSQALAAGRRVAEEFRARGLIRAAYLALQDRRAVIDAEESTDA